MSRSKPSAALAAALVAGALVAGLGAVTALPAVESAASATAPGTTVWLCRPGLAHDPCAASLATTSVAAGGTGTLQEATPAADSPYDCFYAYPTVSTEDRPNADLRIQAAETGVARAQASPFSQVCRVWAPMYRQATLQALAGGISAMSGHDTQVAYDSLRSAWLDYLAHDNDGRPVVFIGHSQGAALLIRLLKAEVDPTFSLRSRTLLAILAGGNLQVPTGKTVGATFKHLALCTRSAEAGCVIAYSSFPSTPPKGSVFGRPGQGVSLQSGERDSAGEQVACVNPAAVGGATGDLVPYFLTASLAGLPQPVTTPWVTFPGLYTAACKSTGGATWLQVSVATRGTRPVVTEVAGPAWGYHVDDVNLAMGNLVGDVSAAEASYAAAHR